MRRKRKSVRDFATEDLAKKIGTLMDNRRRVLAPFPLNPGMVYRRAWSDEERAAIWLLHQNRKGMLREGTTLIVRLAEPLCSISITMPKPVPMPGFTLAVEYDRLTFDQAQALGQWAPQWFELMEQHSKLIDKVKQVGAVCKTFGQLHRLWPDMESFYNDAARAALRHKMARSPYPEGAMRYRDENGVSLVPPVLRSDFRPEVFAQFTSMIAECLMLPVNEDKEVATIARA